MVKCITALHSNLTLLCSRPVHPTNIICRSAFGPTPVVSRTEQEAACVLFPAWCFLCLPPRWGVAQRIGTWAFFPRPQAWEDSTPADGDATVFGACHHLWLSLLPLLRAACRLWSQAAPPVGRAPGRGGVCECTQTGRAGCWALGSPGSGYVLSAAHSAHSSCLQIRLSPPTRSCAEEGGDSDPLQPSGPPLSLPSKCAARSFRTAYG